jgi:hypothetical protein
MAGCLGITSIGTPQSAEDRGSLASLVAKADRRRESQLVGEVRSFRRYTLRNPRWKSDSVMEVEVISEGPTNRQYKILSMDAAGIQKKVFLKLLDGEVKNSQTNEEKGWITPENYDLKPIPEAKPINGRPCSWVQLLPKKNSKFIMEGRACIDTVDHALVRLEGRPVKSLSFWVGKPEIIQEFQKHGNFWLYSRLTSTANVRFVGTTELTIDYLDYSGLPAGTATLSHCTTGPCDPAVAATRQ